MARLDLLLDDDGDLLIQNGDLVIGPSEFQEIKEIALANPGEYKTSPLTGLGISRYLKKVETPTEQQRFVREYREQLEMDKYKVKNIDVSQGIQKFKVTAE